MVRVGVISVVFGVSALFRDRFSILDSRVQNV